MDRDYNSAVNHKQKGLKEIFSCLPVELREFTPVEIPKESYKKKQELCMMATCRLPEEEGEEEETAGVSLPGKPAPFRVW